ncbi:MAG: hypothetical protein ACI36T_01675 [Eggerthellaceae bacterium]
MPRQDLVLDPVERMGYGTGEVTRCSNDGSTDGLITTDEIGFDPIWEPWGVGF